VREAEGGGGEFSEAANLPLSLLIGGKGGCIPPNRREGGLPRPEARSARGTP